MTRERAQHFLAYGIALSIALHLVLLPFVHAERTQAAEQKPDVFHIADIPTPPPTPPPTPTPAPTAQPTRPPLEKPHPPQRPPLAIHPPHTTAHGGSGHEQPNAHATGDPGGLPTGIVPAQPGAADGLVAATPAPEPTPHPTPTPLTCARPDVAASTIRALEPETPAMATQQGVSGTVAVIVSLDTQSRVVGTRIQSSPSVLLNGAALAAARGSQFKTAVKNCEPIAADYIFSVDFTSQ